MDEIIDDYVYKLAETGEWLRCGIIIHGVDCDYIKWFI